MIAGRRRRIGIFGGTFDPIHVGHLVAAVNARVAADLDELLLVVSNSPWQKEGSRAITPAEMRFRLVEDAVRGVDGLRASDIEIRRGGSSYTVDTVNELAGLDPKSDIVLVVGADAAAGLSTWHRFEELAKCVELVVVNRPGAIVEPEALSDWNVTFVEVPSLAVSSTEIRKRVVDGRPLDFLVSRHTIEFIASHRLYS
ncbi:MAG: nicotinate-nucleotide adenylyltransferase [Actinomycetota bacterium]|nr:nicotinate-nucleotide adenylyltransferase [Actinomycetota bacterium]